MQIIGSSTMRRGRGSIGRGSPVLRDITIVAHDVGVLGGMERQLAELVGGLAGRGHRVTVIARTLRLPAEASVTWLKVTCPGRPFPLKYFWFWIAATWKVFQHRRRFPSTIVHTTGAIVANRAHFSTVHHCHHAVHSKTAVVSMSRSNVAYRLNARISELMKVWAETLCYQPALTDQLIGDSAGIAEELATHFPTMRDRIRVIPLGVDSREFERNDDQGRSVRALLSLPPEDLVVIFVGGDWERKGLRLAIEAIGRTKNTGLIVVGDGDVERYLRLSAACGANSRVKFVGKVESTPRFYWAADAFLLPSTYETFSLVAHEAAAASLPLLVTRVNGVEEILTHGRNGWFIERDAKAISARLEVLRDDRDLRITMGLLGRQAVALRTWRAMVDRYESLYTTIGVKKSMPAVNDVQTEGLTQ